MVPNFLRRLTVLLFGLALLLPARPALATAALANDDFANATAISALPFTDSAELDGTTIEPGEPQSCRVLAQSAWYTFTPSSSVGVSVDSTGSDSSIILSLYQSYENGGGIGGLRLLSCPPSGGPMEITADPGATYYLQVGSTSVDPAHLQLNLHAAPPPANDDFANAKAIGGLPFIDNLDMTDATIETGEPVNPSGANGQLAASAWYTFAPVLTESLTVSGGNQYPATPIVAVYTGSSLTGLTEVASRTIWPVTFRAVSGTTYYFQLGRGGVFGAGSPLLMSFSLEVAPPPVANYYSYPSDPSVFDTIQFYDASYDPAQAGIQSQVWDFGDGMAATGCCPTHRFTTDADNTVRLTITTSDGRTATASQVMHVKTHDVAITKLSAPTGAKSGRTGRITAHVSDTRYAETVQVQLFKSVPGTGGFQLVGTLTQSIPVRPKSQTTPFDLDYTFTSDDATVGKVTFEAVASVLNARDALPADNAAIAPPTKVNP